MKGLTVAQQRAFRGVGKTKAVIREHEAELLAVLHFRNTVRNYLVLALLLTFVLSVTYGVIAFLKLFLNFFEPFPLAISYTVLTGISSMIAFMLVWTLYHYKFVGDMGGQFTGKDRKMFLASVWDYYEPGCVYDCRMVENRRDVISLVWTLLLTFAFSNALYWLNANQHAIPSAATPEGIRYGGTLVMLIMLEALRIYAIITALWAFYRVAILVPETIRPLR